MPVDLAFPSIGLTRCPPPPQTQTEDGQRWTKVRAHYPPTTRTRLISVSSVITPGRWDAP